MNIKGASRAGGKELAAHLGNAEKNEKVTVVRVLGTVAQDLPGAFAEMEATATGSRCKLPLYHAKISPDPKEPRLTPEQWDRAVERLAKEMGMEGHAYVLVLHQKYGKRTPDVLREHGHVVFNRIDPDTMRAAHDGHNYRKHEIVARDLEKEFGHARIQGAHIGREDQPRPNRTPPDWQMQQAARTGIQPESVADTVKRVWSETGKDVSGLPAALREEGLTLAVGRRDLVVLDAEGGMHTLARCLDLKAAEIREQTGALDRSKLPTVEQARETIRELKSYKDTAAPGWDRDQANADWMNAVINAAIEKEKTGTSPPRETQQQSKAGTLPAPLRRSIPADTEGMKDKLAAFGFDGSKAAMIEKWLQLDDKVESGQITEKDRLRAMSFYAWDQADKERRTDASIEKQLTREKEPDRDR